MTVAKYKKVIYHSAKVRERGEVFAPPSRKKKWPGMKSPPPRTPHFLCNTSRKPQRPSGVRIQQKDYFKQHGLNDLSGCIMTREETRLVAILA